MKEYPHLLADDPEWRERATRVSAKVRDVSELLVGGRTGARRRCRASRGVRRAVSPDACAARDGSAARRAARDSRRSRWCRSRRATCAAAAPASTTSSSRTRRTRCSSASSRTSRPREPMCRHRQSRAASCRSVPVCVRAGSPTRTDPSRRAARRELRERHGSVIVGRSPRGARFRAGFTYDSWLMSFCSSWKVSCSTRRAIREASVREAMTALGLADDCGRSTTCWPISSRCAPRARSRRTSPRGTRRCSRVRARSSTTRPRRRGSPS